MDGLVYATGHFRNGVLLAPVTAQLVADAMLSGRIDPALDAVGPQRFEGAVSEPRDWLEWQRDHAAALAALQEAQRAYHRVAVAAVDSRQSAVGSRRSTSTMQRGARGCSRRRG